MGARRIRTLMACCAVIAGAVAYPATANAGSDQRPWFCTANDPMPMHGHEESEFYPEPKGPLSWEDCHELRGQLTDAKRAALQYPTAKDAVEGGYRLIVPYFKGMGAHYIGPYPLDTFDPARPNFLMYGGNGPDAPLVGLMYTSVGSRPPAEGFAGGNDHWHRHEPLCFVDGLVVAEGLTNEQCAARGGVNIDVSWLWMVHVWIVPGWTYKPDIFRAHHPDLGPTPPA